ncbi:MAG: tRNA lysidine(34) synthetase TilS [Candidatus Gastranaerophilales bacterium]|nr:tRNA lysidine(34) synthetase TilS [Candidatus Gastranaerophilales bacterium]
MLSVVKEFLEKYNIKNKKVVVGFSAGPDSVAMVFLLFKLANEFGLEIILAYFNHNWRPVEALEEQKFAKEFSKKIKAQFYTDIAPQDSVKSEECARDLRYAFFEKAMKKYESDVVFLAHNKNDNIETAIYRIIKGTGVKGLCSIQERRDNYYRPLLSITKEEILKFLKDNNLEYKIDSSNENIRYKRNLIRKKVFPLFEEINPSFLNNVENLINNSIATRQIVDNELEKFKKNILIENGFDRELYLSYEKPLRYEFLNDFIGDNFKCRNFKNIKKVDDFILKNKSSQISINRCLFLKIKKNKIFYVEYNNYDK